MSTFAERNRAAMATKTSARPPGNVWAPEQIAINEALRVRLGIASLPPDFPPNYFTDVLLPLTPMGDAAVTAKYVQDWCMAPAFYCEAERISWAAEHPWCPPNVVPLVTTPVFTDERARTEWMRTHSGCPVPPPVLDNHTCTPGDPACDTRAQGGSGMNLWPVALIGLSVLGLAWLGGQASQRANPSSSPTGRHRAAFMKTLRKFMAEHEPHETRFGEHEPEGRHVEGLSKRARDWLKSDAGHKAARRAGLQFHVLPDSVLAVPYEEGTKRALERESEA